MGTVLIVGFCIFIGWTYFTNLMSPAEFPAPSTFTIEENESLRSVSARLEEEHYIRSAFLFRAWVSKVGRDRSVHSGGYVFDKPVSLGVVVAKRMEQTMR